MVRGASRRVGTARAVYGHAGGSREVGVAVGGGRGGFAARYRVRRTRGPARRGPAADRAGKIVQRRRRPAPSPRIGVRPARLGARREPRPSGLARRAVQNGPPADRLVRQPVREWLQRREVRLPRSRRVDAGVVDRPDRRPAAGHRPAAPQAARGPRIAQRAAVRRRRGISATRARGRGYYVVAGRVAVKWIRVLRYPGRWVSGWTGYDATQYS